MKRVGHIVGDESVGGMRGGQASDTAVEEEKCTLPPEVGGVEDATVREKREVMGGVRHLEGTGKRGDNELCELAPGLVAGRGPEGKAIGEDGDENGLHEDDDGKGVSAGRDNDTRDREGFGARLHEDAVEMIVPLEFGVVGEAEVVVGVGDGEGVCTKDKVGAGRWASTVAIENDDLGFGETRSHQMTQ